MIEKLATVGVFIAFASSRREPGTKIRRPLSRSVVEEVIDFGSLHGLLDAGSRYFGKPISLAVWAKEARPH